MDLTVHGATGHHFLRVLAPCVLRVLRVLMEHAIVNGCAKVLIQNSPACGVLGRKLKLKDVIVQVGIIKFCHNIRETSPYSFGNFRKLSLYNCLCPFNL